MVKILTNKNNNSVNIADDVYIIEKESYYKKRGKVQYVGGGSNGRLVELDTHGYHYYYEAILKSVNCQNAIVYRYYMMNPDDFNDKDLSLNGYVEAFRNSDGADFFYQPGNTAIIFDGEGLSYAHVNVWWNKLPTNYDIDEFINDGECSWKDELWLVD